MSNEIINIVAIFLFILLVIFYVFIAERKTRKLEERLDKQERLRERTCRKCANFMVEIHNETGSQSGYRCTGRFACFIDRKEVKPFQKACKQYEKQTGGD